MAQECVLCRRARPKRSICGKKFQWREFFLHRFCLIFASHVPKRPSARRRCYQYLYGDVTRAIELAAEEECCVCRESGPTITCCQEGCERSFHLPCAAKGNCITQYFSPYSSFCRDHRPEQQVEAAQEGTSTCLICLEVVDDRKTYRTLVCPACKHAWFHRNCIQGQALRDGITQLQCPLCRDKDTFRGEMLRLGVRIPFRAPRLDMEAFAELNARHGRCDASECLCPGGRERAEQDGPWELLLCSSCAAEGTHRSCSRLDNTAESWECHGCAGPSTASRTTPEPAGPSGPSQAAPASALGSPPAEGNGRSSPAGPMRLRDRSRLRRRAPDPYDRQGRRRERARPAPRAGSGTPGPAAPGLPAARPDLRRPPPPAASGAGSEPAGPTTRSRAARGPESVGSRPGCPGPLRVPRRSRSTRRDQAPYRRPGPRRRP